MAQLSSQGNNAIIYLTYAFLLATGLLLAWKFGNKNNFLASNGTQTGIPLAINFIASGTYYLILTRCNWPAGASSFLLRTEGAETKPFALDQDRSCVRRLSCSKISNIDSS